MTTPNIRIALALAKAIAAEEYPPETWFELRIAGEVAAKLRPDSAAMLARIGMAERHGKLAESPHCECAPYRVVQSDFERGLVCMTCGKKMAERHGKPAESPHCECAPYRELQNDFERGYVCATCGKKVVL